ncbi:hypothetical protein TWF696_003993 [Orbilia brochopaga]|uniref:Uncharacterized protein n=1 Tax=Orbilia brochopaga TaxID=3140254 RepID=A0AAV9V4V0_9PEZI
MRELILMQAIINAYNIPPKFELASKALGITMKAVSGRYGRLKKKIEAAATAFPLYDVDENGNPIKRGRGRPPKRQQFAMAAPTVLADEGEEEDDEEQISTTFETGKGAKGVKKRKVKEEKPALVENGNSKLLVPFDGDDEELLDDAAYIFKQENIID